MRRSRRAKVFAVFLALALLIVFELLAHLGLAALEDGWRRPSSRAAEQRALAEGGTIVDPAADAIDPAAAAGDEAAAGLPPARRQAIVLHPFFGFARDPDRPGGHYAVTENGFFAPRQTSPEDAFTVAVFGGSVANHVTFAGHRTIAQAVRAAVPDAGGGAVAVRSFAMGGFKQPQQSMALAYLLARGERIDVVVNLDGFNEVALPFDNLAAGVAPDYPVHWTTLASELHDAESLRAIGELAALRARRAERAARWSGGALRYCAACQLWWRLGDDRLAAGIAAAQTRLAARTAGTRSFQSHGPPVEPLERDQRLRALARLWARSSRHMDAVARSHGVPYVHLLQPNQYLPGSKPLSAEERRIAYDPEIHHRVLVERGYPLLSEAGRELRGEGIAFHDLSLLFRDDPETRYADVCCHFNRGGYVRLAAAVGDAVAGALAGRSGATTP